MRNPTAAIAAMAPSARPLARSAVKVLTGRSRRWFPRPWSGGRGTGRSGSRLRRTSGHFAAVVLAGAAVVAVVAAEPEAPVGGNVSFFAAFSLPAWSHFVMYEVCRRMLPESSLYFPQAPVNEVFGIAASSFAASVEPAFWAAA